MGAYAPILYHFIYIASPWRCVVAPEGGWGNDNLCKAIYRRSK